MLLGDGGSSQGGEAAHQVVELGIPGVTVVGAVWVSSKVSSLMNTRMVDERHDSQNNSEKNAREEQSEEKRAREFVQTSEQVSAESFRRMTFHEMLEDLLAFV